MSDVKHTPGPWHTVFNAPAQDRSEVCSIYDASGEPTSGYVADVYRNYVGAFIGEEEYRANARLIAAAPDMRAALEPFEALFHDFVGTVNEEWFDRFAKATTDARAAISKAKGISPKVEDKPDSV